MTDLQFNKNLLETFSCWKSEVITELSVTGHTAHDLFTKCSKRYKTCKMSLNGAIKYALVNNRNTSLRVKGRTFKADRQRK